MSCPELDTCPDCGHHWHSGRCFYVGQEKGHLKSSQCPGSPSLMELGRRLEQEAKELGDESRRLLTNEGMRGFFGR